MSEVVSIVVKGGVVMVLLLACSLISLTLTIERFIFWGKIKSQQAVRDMLTMVEAGEFEKALKVGMDSPHPIARVMAQAWRTAIPRRPKPWKPPHKRNSRCSRVGSAPSTRLSP